VSRLEREDEVLLAGRARLLQEVIQSTVLDNIARGILQIVNTTPEDPVDALAVFLFAKHRKQKKYHSRGPHAARPHRVKARSDLQ
jgi:hypothetical protein